MACPSEPTAQVEKALSVYWQLQKNSLRCSVIAPPDHQEPDGGHDSAPWYMIRVAESMRDRGSCVRDWNWTHLATCAAKQRTCRRCRVNLAAVFASHRRLQFGSFINPSAPVLIPENLNWSSSPAGTVKTRGKTKRSANAPGFSRGSVSASCKLIVK